MRSLLLCFFFLTISFHGEAQNALNRLSGKVLDKQSGEPLAAQLFFKTLPNGDKQGITQTHVDNGVFEVDIHEYKPYEITVKAEGYYPLREVLSYKQIDSMAIHVIHLEKIVKDSAIRLNGLYFPQGSAKLEMRSHRSLDNLAEFLKENSEVVIRIEGHTDVVGAAKANKNLSERRVETVCDYLHEQGISRHRLKSKAFGEQRPIVTDKDSDQSYLNRRVEVRFLEI